MCSEGNDEGQETSPYGWKLTSRPTDLQIKLKATFACLLAEVPVARRLAWHEARPGTSEYSAERVQNITTGLETWALISLLKKNKEDTDGV
jgi:hypothetical protein